MHFPQFKSSSSLSFMLSIVVIPDVHSNMGYWSKFGCFYFLDSSSAFLKISLYISSYIQPYMWLSFPVHKYMCHTRYLWIIYEKICGVV